MPQSNHDVNWAQSVRVPLCRFLSRLWGQGPGHSLSLQTEWCSLAEERC